jgi:hypothetical protein
LSSLILQSASNKKRDERNITYFCQWRPIPAGKRTDLGTEGKIMRILIAPDSFKESLTALEAAQAIQSGFQEVFVQAEYDLLPIGDGGEGTVSSLADSLRLKRQTAVGRRTDTTIVTTRCSTHHHRRWRKV